MTSTPLRDGIAAALETAWGQEQLLLAADVEAADLIGTAAAGRELAASWLERMAAGERVDTCAVPDQATGATAGAAAGRVATAVAALHAALAGTGEAQLAAPPVHDCDHPQYVWRDIFIAAARRPVLACAERHLAAGRPDDAVAAVRALHDRVHDGTLPTKAHSDAAYDLACALAQAGRLDEAMDHLPEAFTANDAEAVPVLRDWARRDTDLAALRGRVDFQALVGA